MQFSSALLISTLAALASAYSTVTVVNGGATYEEVVTESSDLTAPEGAYITASSLVITRNGNTFTKIFYSTAYSEGGASTASSEEASTTSAAESSSETSSAASETSSAAPSETASSEESSSTEASSSEASVEVASSTAAEVSTFSGAAGNLGAGLSGVAGVVAVALLI